VDPLINSTEKGPVKWLVLFLQVLSAVTLFALMMVTCVDVVGGYVFNSPLTGSTELTEIAVGIVVFSVLPIISWRNDHIVVDLLDPLFPALTQFIRTIIINICISIGLVYLGQRINVLGERSLSYEEVTEYLEIPAGWMMHFIGYICWLTAFMVVTLGIFRAYREYRRKLALTNVNKS
jgi:TRAP-type C4-dicarboxylate transport system permease small subunit